ncbi:tripartite tricarboxylate transporter TctB family protein [Inquilinus limosus]|uniref:tripartite tricarboxylate transporter TctB family protein n=1 Tax=Inquilinus limosus TaxID=171674 RepID=UPI003F148BEB
MSERHMPESGGISRFAMECAASAATGAVGAAVTVGGLQSGIGWNEAGPEPGTFPFAVGLIIVAGSLGTLVQALLSRDGAVFLDGVRLRRVAAFFGPMAAFVALSIPLGLYVASALYLAGVMRLQGGYRLRSAVPVGLGVATLLWLVFETWFQVPLLKGPVEAWLGLA